MNDLFRLALDSSVRIAVVAACVGATLIVARVRSGAVRHAGWSAVLFAMLLMPVLPTLAPEIGVTMEAPAMSWAAVQQETGSPAIPTQQAMVRELTLHLPPPAARGPVWPVIVLSVYTAGMLFLLAKMAAGWLAARRLSLAAEPVAGIPVYQSADIAAPLIVGILHPRILLPLDWTEWSDATLHAVLAHETAHLRRRDTLVAFLAGLNRCVFWFHPLSWWLQRKLAATAELACDEAGVRAVGHSRDYAAVLLDMAEAVRCRGRRISWASLGMYGAGSLEQRIDRILRGDAARPVPLRHKALVALGCATAIFFTASCQRNAATTTTAAASRLDSEETFRRANFYSAVLMALPEAYAMSRLSPSDYAASAAEIRNRLVQSRDLTLVLQASTTLVAWGRIRQSKVPADFDLLALGKSLIEHALQLDPNSVWAHQLLNVAADQELLKQLPDAVWQGPLESRHQAIQALSDADRFRELAILAIATGDVAVRADRIRHDAAGAKAAWQQAGTYAHEALDLAAKAQSHPDYGTAFFRANMVLGMAAVQAGDPKAAGAYLLKAAEAPVTNALKYPVANARPWSMNWYFPSLLADALLQAGQRDAVIQFLESYARMTVAGRERCLETIALIREGKPPKWPSAT